MASSRYSSLLIATVLLAVIVLFCGLTTATPLRVPVSRPFGRIVQRSSLSSSAAAAEVEDECAVAPRPIRCYAAGMRKRSSDPREVPIKKGYDYIRFGKRSGNFDYDFIRFSKRFSQEDQLSLNREAVPNDDLAYRV